MIKDKSDVKAVEQIMAIGYPDNISYMDELLSWTCDSNWPVAGKIYPYFVSSGLNEVERVKNIASSDTDYWWLYSILVQIIACYDNETLERCTDWLITIARKAGSEECDIEALRILSERNLMSDHEIAKIAKRNFFVYNLYINLEKSVGSQMSAQALDSSSYVKKVLITLLCSCIRDISASTHKTNKVTAHFFITLSKSIACTSFLRPTDFSRIKETLDIAESAINKSPLSEHTL